MTGEEHDPAPGTPERQEHVRDMVHGQDEVEGGRAITPAPVDLNALMTLAIQTPEGADQLAKLVDLQERMLDRDAKAQFVRAMAAFQAEVPAIYKTRKSGHDVTVKGGKKRGLYAALEDCTVPADPWIRKHGFTYRFDRELVGDQMMVACIVTHEAGHEERCRYPWERGQTNKRTSGLQAIGAGESYARRYAFCGAFGITTLDPDTDGGSGEPERLDAAQLDELKALLLELDGPPAAAGEQHPEFTSRILRFGDVSKLDDFPPALFGQAVAGLDKAVRRKRQGGASDADNPPV